MAKQVGPIKITGTIGGISFYKSGDDYLVRMKGGPTRQQVKTGKNFVRVRENCSEFGNCSKAGKLLRQAVKRWSNTGDGELYWRLTRLLTKVKNEDTTSVRGARCLSKALKNESGKALLRNFDFNKDMALNTVLLKPVYIDKQAQVCIDDLKVARDIVFAEGAAQVIMKAVCLQVNFENGKKTIHDYEGVVIKKQDKKTHVVLKPKDQPTLLNANDGELFYFMSVEFDTTNDKKKNVLCLLDVNVALREVKESAPLKGHTLPFTIGRKIKKNRKENLGFVCATAVVKEAPA